MNDSDTNRREPLLEAKDISEMVGMTEGWIWAQSRANRMPHVKMGRFYRYRRSAIESWLEEIEQGPTIRSNTNKRSRIA